MATAGNPPEQRWAVVETDIPWRTEYWHRVCNDREYYRQWHEESYLFLDLLEGKVDEEVLDKVFQESEEHVDKKMCLSPDYWRWC